jgi:Domain of unknown function (DUF4349)
MMRGCTAESAGRGIKDADEDQIIASRLKLLADLTDMTTVALIIHEKQKYIAEQAPAVVENPPFGTRLGRSLGDSAGSFLELCQTLAIFLAVLLPWLPLLLAAAIPAWIYVQRLRHAPVAEAVKVAPANPSSQA